MGAFRRSYATRRVRFMLRHNPSFFLMAVKRPGEFFRSVWDLGKYYVDVLLDPTNSSESWVAKTLRKVKGQSKQAKARPVMRVTKGGEVR